MTKLIGLSPRLLTEDTVEKQFVNTRYLTPLNKRGLNTIMISLDNPNVEDILKLCDGFLITGGTDLDPTTYNQINNGLSKGIDLRLDNLDKLIIEHAVKHKKPLLGICRGHQSLNVFLGGTLYQDLDHLNNNHNKVKENHFIQIDKNDFINIDGIINVNSYHHQAIKDLAEDLEVIGRHNDQTIEMVFHKTLPIFAVQWHPEINSESQISQIIFDKFNHLIKNQ
ncbi:MAG: type 1 glutamine amidotransferase [Acholeplasmataceae bacterium]|nr:type 1 glutamine amidotransferase [Acholeplasmataceae bacterium]